jgi:hypothetical protein
MSRSALGRMLLALVAVGFVPLAWAEAQSTAPPAAPSAATSSKTHDFTDSLSCSACHTTTAWRARDASGENQRFDHSRTGFPLTGEHVNAPCVSCHDSTRVIKRECASCHEDFHRGRLSQSCDRCHSPAGWSVTRPLELHRRTRFALTGMHVVADCTECHLRANEQKFTDAPVACFACHERDYRRPDLFPVHTGTAGTPPFSRDCSQCHRALAWVPAVGPMAAAMARSSSGLAIAPPNHDLRFPVSFGVHRTASCDDCHASSAVPRAVRCIGCHAHDRARLMEQHRAPVAPIASDGAACLGCHLGGARR